DAGDAGVDATADGPACETLFASVQDVMGTSATGVTGRALGAPDGLVDFLMGSIAHPGMAWTFGFPAATTAGTVSAAAWFVLGQVGWTDDVLVLQASPDGGTSWTTLVQYGGAGGTALPNGLVMVGPFAAPTITSPPAAGQPALRVQGGGSVGPADSFTF